MLRVLGLNPEISAWGLKVKFELKSKNSMFIYIILNVVTKLVG